MIYLVIILVVISLISAMQSGALIFFVLRDRERASEYKRFEAERRELLDERKHLLNCWLIEKGSYTLDEKVSGAEPDEPDEKPKAETYEDIQRLLREEKEGAGFETSGSGTLANRRRLISEARRLERGETDREPEDKVFDEPVMPGSRDLDKDVMETAN